MRAKTPFAKTTPSLWLSKNATLIGRESFGSRALHSSALPVTQRQFAANERQCFQCCQSRD